MEEPKLLDQASALMRMKHLSNRTEEAYLHWMKRFILFHHKRHPKDMGEKEISDFLTHLAMDLNVSAATQNQALNAMVFLYSEVLKKNLGQFAGMIRAKRARRAPTVFSRNEVREIIGSLTGVTRLVSALLYGSGMRLTECISLRVKDIDFEEGRIVVRSGKGDKDRVVPLPRMLREPLKRQVEFVRIVHEQDLSDGFGEVPLPHALAEKYPHAERELAWQFVFPSSRRTLDEQSHKFIRFHLDPSFIQRNVKNAIRRTAPTTASDWSHVWSVPDRCSPHTSGRKNPGSPLPRPRP